MKNIIKNNYKYVLIFMFILIFGLIVIPGDLDEIWSYGFTHSIYKGLIPYKDFNMIVTPLYPFILSLPFHIFGSSMLVFHITQALLFTGLSYFLFKLIDKKAWIIILLFFFPVAIFFPGYNLLVFFLLIVIIYLEKNNYNDILIGLVIGLSFLTKQTFIVFLLPSLMYIPNIKKISKRLLGFIIPNIVFLIYLICTKSFNSFMNLCIYGLFDFTSGNGKLFTIWMFLTIVLVLITIIYIKKHKQDIMPYYVILFYTLLIPLFDVKHFMEALLAFLFMILYYTKKEIRINYVLAFIIIIIFESCIIISDKTKTKLQYPNKINHFEYKLLDKFSIDITNSVNKYIKNNKYKKIVFMDSNGYYFKIVNDLNIEYTDLLNKGNYGYNGSNKLLNDIKSKKDYIYFIDKQELKRPKQTDKRAIKYVLKHGKKIDTVKLYEVYTLNK
ncbi:MAG: hypothetical protein IKG58_02605 [Bacilli bacterium]|nr:hypothetical protein [Bacilli bacterium]